MTIYMMQGPIEISCLGLNNVVRLKFDLHLDLVFMCQLLLTPTESFAIPWKLKYYCISITPQACKFAKFTKFHRSKRQDYRTPSPLQFFIWCILYHYMNYSCSLFWQKFQLISLEQWNKVVNKFIIYSSNSALTTTNNTLHSRYWKNMKNL